MRSLVTFVLNGISDFARWAERQLAWINFNQREVMTVIYDESGGTRSSMKALTEA
jgi:uncharacterized protein YecT (DUF1311 family)